MFETQPFKTGRRRSTVRLRYTIFDIITSLFVYIVNIAV